MIRFRWNRRGFLQALGMAGATASPLATIGCGSSSVDEDPGGKADGFGETHNDRTMNALFNVFIPSDGPDSVGAVEAGALRLYRSDVLLKAAVEIGSMPSADDGESPADFGENTIVAGLDFAAPGFGAPTFLELSDEQRMLLVRLGMTNPINKGFLEVTRMVAFWAYFGAIFNDLAYRAMGLDKYDDFLARGHNDGYPDACPDEVPSIDGKTVFDIEMD